MAKRMKNHTKQEIRRHFQALNLSDDFMFGEVMSDLELCRMGRGDGVVVPKIIDDSWDTGTELVSQKLSTTLHLRQPWDNNSVPMSHNSVPIICENFT
jgi:hypothetical protein